ncbi:MFS transporter [Pendulispora rubella]|uniref:MFS transporter n=1 Tax=Pendulispora rubella TaxID=2741070 RepID=A0ABZ2L107_9BACT
MHDAPARHDPAPTGTAPKSPVLAIIGASSGNLVEWFDFYTYSFTAIYFASAFFPSGDPTTELLNTAGVFAVGFFMRPLGGWLFGRLADKLGRRTSMMVSVLMMCFGSLMVACLPTYATVGKLAPALLLVARLIQGLSVGGEYGTSATYMSEVAVAGKRGFYASFQYVTLIGGQLLAVLALVILQQLLSADELKAWGWRIPFVLGALGAVVALFLRRSLVETSSAETRHDEKAGTLRGVLQHPRALLIVLGYTAGGSLVFYTYSTYMQKYLVNTAHLARETASQVMTAVLFCYMLMQPAFGALSDRIGRRASMLCFGVFTTLGTVPLLTALGQVQSPMAAFALLLLALAGVSFYTSISGLVKAEMFPPEIRALAVGLSYAIGNAAFGGTAEYVALRFKAHGLERGYFWYVTVLAAVALLASWAMPDPRKHGYLRDEAAPPGKGAPAPSAVENVDG